MASHVQGWNILIGKVWGKLKGQERVKKEEGLRIVGGSGGLLLQKQSGGLLSHPGPVVNQGKYPEKTVIATVASFYLLQGCPL